MRYYVKISGKEHEIDLKEEGNGLIARLDGKSYRLRPAEVEAGSSYSIIVEDESFNVSFNQNASTLNMIVGGYLYQAEVLDDREKGAQELESANKNKGLQIVQSVMPGIVRKVFVKEGETVAHGSSLLILEAMKMENEISAESDGNVIKVHVEEGKTVNSGDPLVTIDQPKE